MNKKILNGNEAVVEALKLSRVRVIAAYPITPQSPIIEQLAVEVTNKKINATYIRVESEHSALSCVIGAQLTGIRATTATSSVGLAFMHEVLGLASGCRLPIVMPVVNRALVAPWSLWCDHQDSMAERDSGWLQFYAEDAQEALDLVLFAYKVSEDAKVLLPAMVCLDGFFVSHSTQVVKVPKQTEVDCFLPSYKARNLRIDCDVPMFINTLTLPDEFSEMRYQQEQAFTNASKLITHVSDTFYNFFGRKYGLLEEYKTECADYVLIAMGSMAGTIKHVLNKLKIDGFKVGLIKIISFRPFPYVAIKRILRDKISVGVIDRSAGLGAQLGPLCLEVVASVGVVKNLYNFVIGLGGRDVTEKTIEKIIKIFVNKKEDIVSRKIWIDTDKKNLDIRAISYEG